MGLKKNSNGHLLKNSTGHLADTCGSTQNWKYEECHDDECWDCPVGKYPSIFLTISWTGINTTDTFFPYCDEWFNGQRKEICPDVYSYTAPTTGAPGSETWQRNGNGTNPGIYLRLGNLLDAYYTYTTPSRFVNFRSFGYKLQMKKRGTTVSPEVGSYTNNLSTHNFDPNDFTLNTTNEYIQDPSFGQLTTSAGVTYKWERGNQTAPTYSTKVFATDQGQAIKIGGVCYNYIGRTDDAVDAGTITDTYDDCLECTDNFVYKKCVKCGCTIDNTDPTIYITMSWSGDEYDTKSAFNCIFRNGERKEMCAYYYGAPYPPRSSANGESWINGSLIINKAQTTVFYSSFYTLGNMQVKFDIDGTFMLTATWQKHWRSPYSGSTSFVTQIATDNMNLSTWVAGSTPVEIEDKQFGQLTTTDGLTIKWERGRFWDGVGLPEEEKVFDKNMGNVVMIDGECWSIIRVDNSTVNAYPSDVQDSFSDCSLCEKDSSSSSSSSS